MSLSREQIMKQIASTYGKGDVFEKSQNNDLEKGGEGSRGGVISGHDANGKPIYGAQGFSAANHGNLGKFAKDAVKTTFGAKNDGQSVRGATHQGTQVRVHKENGAHNIHFDAHKPGTGVGTKEDGENAEKHYHATADGLRKHFEENGYKVTDKEKGNQSFPQTTHHFHAQKDGKTIRVRAQKGGTEGAISIKDLSPKEEVKKSESNDIFEATKNHNSQINSQIAGLYEDQFAKSEGSKGGKVIGHTKSGKPIYGHQYSAKSEPGAGLQKYAQQYGQGGFKSMSKEDHEDAAEIHSQKSNEVSKKSPNAGDAHSDIAFQHKKAAGSTQSYQEHDSERREKQSK